jgi:hypothetical protein
MTQSNKSSAEEQEMHKALRALVYEEEDRQYALCGENCPLDGRAKATESRYWAFAPEPTPGTHVQDGLSMEDKDIALACLSRFKRGICQQPNPTKGE